MGSSRSAGTPGFRRRTRRSSAARTRGRPGAEPAMPVSGPPVDDDHAVIIGIERYRDRRLARLKGARSDAVRFHRWVTSPRGGRVKPENATLIAPPRAMSRDATLRAVKRAFVTLCARAQER